MEHIRGMDRNQVILFPEVIDDCITEYDDTSMVFAVSIIPVSLI